MKMKSGLSSSLEDYLREIYVLEQKDKEVRVTDVAQLLGISKPSVNRAMNTLKEQGYIEHEHYGTIRLTKAGLEAGKNVYDTYKVVYKFLTDKQDCLLYYNIVIWRQGWKRKHWIHWKKSSRRPWRNFWKRDFLKHLCVRS